jgi:hypothetical protein
LGMVQTHEEQGLAQAGAAAPELPNAECRVMTS